jgi:Na+/H+ antiporter NhaC
MEAVNVQLWAFVPALTAIVTVFIFHDVIASLLIGVLTGSLVYVIAAGTGPRDFLTLLFTGIFNSATENIPLITLMFMLGALVSVITLSGGHFAYGRWAAKKLKTAEGVSLSSVILGMLIFIDDYFSCLLTGAVMGPAVDKHKISREKLAYLIDSTAAPVCIMAPVSSWAMTITQVIEESGGKGGLVTFLRSIPYNFYALFALAFVVYIALSRRDFSVMRKFEAKRAADPQEDKSNPGFYDTEHDITCKPVSERGHILDLILPNAAVIILALFSIIWLGDFFGPEKISLVDAYLKADTTLAIVFGCLGALVLCFVLYIPRRLVSVRLFFEGMVEGMKSMFAAVLILVLAWSLSSITTESLGAASYIDSVMNGMEGSLNLSFLPLVIFVLSAVVSFGLGSWGTFLVTIPFLVIIANAVNPSGFFLYLSATLAGSVFGDHASPITDTTILASIGAKCNHIGHVQSQLPYALVVCLGSAAAFLLMGLTGSLIVSYAAGTLFIVGALCVIYKLERGKYGQQANK